MPLFTWSHAATHCSCPQLGEAAGVAIGEVGLGACREGRRPECGGGCVLRAGLSGQFTVVDANTSAVVGPRLSLHATCGCGGVPAGDSRACTRGTCLNGGRCVNTSTGARWVSVCCGRRYRDPRPVPLTAPLPPQVCLPSSRLRRQVQGALQTLQGRQERVWMGVDAALAALRRDAPQSGGVDARPRCHAAVRRSGPPAAQTRPPSYQGRGGPRAKGGKTLFAAGPGRRARHPHRQHDRPPE